MDRSFSGGLSWADQWDTSDDPPPSNLHEAKKGKKGKRPSSSKNSKGTNGGAFGWIKELFRNKSQKQFGLDYSPLLISLNLLFIYILLAICTLSNWNQSNFTTLKYIMHFCLIYLKIYKFRIFCMHYKLRETCFALALKSSLSKTLSSMNIDTARIGKILMYVKNKDNRGKEQSHGIHERVGSRVTQELERPSAEKSGATGGYRHYKKILIQP